MKEIRGLFVDNFAGGGGASTGIEMAIGRSVNIAINHDPDAIAMHKVNHPATKHYCENIWEVDPEEACEGHLVTLAWFSPDCKHFSRAKGGKPLDRNIRGLAWVTIKWALSVRPKVIMLENVPEIQTWGPLDESGKPIKAHMGETFEGFISALTTGVSRSHAAFSEMCEALSITEESEAASRLVCGLGYDLEYRLLKSCDYGAPTTRTRFYLIARCDGRPIVWPLASHADRDSAEVPLSTITSVGNHSVVTPYITKFQQNSIGNDMERPLDTVMAGAQRFGLVTPMIVPVGYGERDGQAPRVNSVEEPLGTCVSSGKHYLCAPTLIQYHSETSENEVRGQAVDEPIMTVDTAPRYVLSCAHIMKNYAGGYTGAGSGADEPLDTVTAKDHNSLVTAHIMTMRRHMDGQALDEPLTTVSCSGAHHAEVQAFLMKYYHTGGPKSVEEPLDTVTAKDRFALVTIHGEEYIITDIKMRMLQPRELFNAQGFPPDYVIDRDANGNPYPKTKQVARCGNAVTPQVPTALVRANLPEECA